MDDGVVFATDPDEHDSIHAALSVPTIFDWSVSGKGDEMFLSYGDRTPLSEGRCYLFKGWRYGVPWLAWAWATNDDQAMRKARAVFGAGLTAVPDIYGRQPMLMNLYEMVLERDKLKLWQRIKLWFSRIHLGFEQEDFVGRHQLLRVWWWGRMHWEVWDWGPEGSAQDAADWLNKLPAKAVVSRYDRIERSATMLVRTQSFGEARAYLKRVA